MLNELNEWFESQVSPKLPIRVWHLVTLTILSLILLIIVVCCLKDCRIPRTRQQIERKRKQNQHRSSFIRYLRQLQNLDLPFEQSKFFFKKRKTSCCWLDDIAVCVIFFYFRCLEHCTYSPNFHLSICFTKIFLCFSISSNRSLIKFFFSILSSSRNRNHYILPVHKLI